MGEIRAHMGSGSPNWPVCLFVLLVVAGLVLRAVAATSSCGIAHPDEHQQYLEQAQRLAFGGPAQRFWEQDRGMRNLLYPHALAALLVIVDGLGVHDPFAQAAALRFVLAASVFLLIAWQAGLELRRGNTVRGVAQIFLAALTTGVIYVHVRILSENAMAIPLVLALMSFERRPAIAGAWLGVMLAVRLQSAFLVLAFLLSAFADDVCCGRTSRKTLRAMHSVRMTAGLLIAAGLAMGLLDRLTLGGWFHSAVENVRANVVERRADDWGVQPWDFYARGLGKALFVASPFLLILLVAGAWKERRLAFAALVMVAGHSAIGHKELRFVWGLLPVALVLAARGVETAWNWMGAGFRRASIMTGLAASFLLGSLYSLQELSWSTEPYRSSASALAAIGRCSDVTGVAVCGVPMWECGNYFFLRRPVPLAFWHADEIRSELVRSGQSFNYVIVPRSGLSTFPSERLRVIAECGELLACRLVTYEGSDQVAQREGR